MSVELVKWGNGILSKPDPTKFPAFYPRDYHPRPGMVEALKEMGGDGLVSVFGYGSAFNGEGNGASLTDLMVVVASPYDFHRDNIRRGWLHYGTTSNPGFHAALNKIGLNFYAGELPIDSEELRIKAGVIGLKEFLRFAQGSLRKPGGLYLAGRLHKARFIPLVEADYGRHSQMDLAINRARLDGIWLALGLVHDTFHIQRLKERYTALSYLADARVEVVDKHKILIKHSSEDYEHMFRVLVAAFGSEGLLVTGSWSGEYQKRYSLPAGEVEAWLGESARKAFLINYFKNWATFGLGRGFKYAWAKIRKSISAATLME